MKDKYGISRVEIKTIEIKRTPVTIIPYPKEEKGVKGLIEKLKSNFRR